MIKQSSFSQEWINAVSEKYQYHDRNLIEYVRAGRTKERQENQVSRLSVTIISPCAGPLMSNTPPR